MPSSISQRLISDSLDEIGFDSNIDKDCDLYIILHGDGDFPYNVQIYYEVENDKWLRVFAVSPDLDSRCYNRQRNLEAINKCNSEQKMTKAYLHNNGTRIVVERYELIDEYVSDDYLKKNCLKFNTQCMWRAFVRLGQLL